MTTLRDNFVDSASGSREDEDAALDELESMGELPCLAEVDADLAAFLSSTRAGLDELLTAGLGMPDVAASVRLAHVLDPERVPEDWVERAEAEANVVSLRRRPTAETEALAPFVQALRSSVESAVLERRMAEIPPLRTQVSPVAGTVAEAASVAPSANVVAFPSRRALARAAVVAASLAALVALAALGRFVSTSELAQPSGSLPGMAASLSGHVEQGSRATEVVHDDRHDGLRLADATSPNTGEATNPTPELGADIGGSDESESKHEPTKDEAAASDAHGSGTAPARRALRPRVASSATVAGDQLEAETLEDDVATATLDDRLRALEAEATAAWNEGRLEDARQLLEKIVTLGGARRRVESAFADLFALTRQQHTGAAREAALNDLWTRYLDRFPRGRHADDARAGLCRTARTTERAACWTDYVSNHPRGEHLDTAKAALDATTG